LDPNPEGRAFRPPKKVPSSVAPAGLDRAKKIKTWG
jgi:hypothetical protein